MHPIWKGKRMNIDIRDVTILFLCVVVVCLLRSCADNGNRAAVLPLPAEDAETPADNVTPMRWAS